jgi:hypothetical protein
LRRIDPLPGIDLETEEYSSCYAIGVKETTVSKQLSVDDIQTIATQPTMATIEILLEAMFPVGSDPRLYNEDTSRAAVSIVGSSVE